MPRTDLEVKNAKPKERPYKLNDGKGLFLHISSSGKKTWRYRYKIAGTESVLVIGVYPLMPLLAARVEAETMRQKVKSGINLSKERQSEKLHTLQKEEENEQSVLNSFENVAHEWHEREKGR